MARFFILLALAVGLSSPAFAASELLPVGSEAKTFLILDPDGKRVGLRDFVGPKASEKPKLLVLSFWSLTCVPCRIEMPLLQTWADKHPEAKLLFISVDAKSEQDKVVATMKERGLKASLLLDFYQATGKNYQVCAGSSCNVPALYAIDPAGFVRLSISGFDESRDILGMLDQALANAGQAVAPPAMNAGGNANQKKFQALHDALKSIPLDETAARNGMTRDQLIEVFKEAESAARKSWNLQ